MLGRVLKIPLLFSTALATVSAIFAEYRVCPLDMKGTHYRHSVKKALPADKLWARKVTHEHRMWKKILKA